LATPHDAAGNITMLWDLYICSPQYTSHFPHRIWRGCFEAYFCLFVFGITAVACLAEGPFGKYKRKV
jgi:hypothetical protein